MHTSVLEGVNNRIKVIKRMAYGFRDSEYFFLKIKAAFPGKRDEPFCDGLSGARLRFVGQRSTVILLSHTNLSVMAPTTIVMELRRDY